MTLLTIILIIILALFLVVGIVCAVLIIHITRQIVKTRQSAAAARGNIERTVALVSQVSSVVGIASGLLVKAKTLRTKLVKRRKG